MNFQQRIASLKQTVHQAVPFKPERDRLLLLDFTEANTALTGEIVTDIVLFSEYVNMQLKQSSATYGIGGYNEHRTVYSRSKVFDPSNPGEEPRRLHLGIDIWGNAGTPVAASLPGVVHSFAFNDHYGDYGATIIIKHEFENFSFHTLYGHLSLKDLDNLSEGKPIKGGEEIAHFGEPHENGYWPPHLHFQVILDMGENKGDYPGVCGFSERDVYLANCPDPDSLLHMMQFAEKA